MTRSSSTDLIVRMPVLLSSFVLQPKSESKRRSHPGEDDEEADADDMDMPPNSERTSLCKSCLTIRRILAKHVIVCAVDHALGPVLGRIWGEHQPRKARP